MYMSVVVNALSYMQVYCTVCSFVTLTHDYLYHHTTRHYAIFLLYHVMSILHDVLLRCYYYHDFAWFHVGDIFESLFQRLSLPCNHDAFR